MAQPESSPSEPAVTFIASDGVTTVTVPKAHTRQSLLLRDLLDGTDDTEPQTVPLAHVDAETLQLVAAYFEMRHSNPPREIERPLREPLFKMLDEIDRKFLEPLDESRVLKLVVASNFLNYPALFGLSCARCADWMCDKNVDEIRDMFGIKCDFTAEEIAALKKEHGLEIE